MYTHPVLCQDISELMKWPHFFFLGADILTSTVEMKDESKGRIVQKPKVCLCFHVLIIVHPNDRHFGENQSAFLG